MNSNGVSPGFWEWIAAIDNDERSMLIAMTIVFCLIAVVLVVAIIAVAVSRVHRLRLETALKRELLDRGLSADEIVSVMAVSGGRGMKLTPQQRG